MKIIVVNITNTISTDKSVEITKRAWKLNINRATQYSFVIDVSKNTSQTYFKILNVDIDSFHPNRIEFNLAPCPESEKKTKKYIDNNKINLRSFTTKYIN